MPERTDDELIVRSKAALAAWDCVHVVASIDVMATDIPDTIERAYREAPGLVRELVEPFEQVHEWGHERADEVMKLVALQRPPADGADAELFYLRGYEAGVIQEKANQAAREAGQQ